MVTTQEYATLSERVYGGSSAPELPAGWTRIDKSDPTSSGFYGEAYQNAAGEIVIAFRGTEVTDGGDLRADREILLGRVPGQSADALEFYNKVLGNNPGAEISLTGHSLGGALVQSVAAQDGSHPSGVTFGAPGIADLLNNIDGAVNVQNFVNPNDPFGSFGDHVGQVIQVGDRFAPSVVAAAGPGFLVLALQTHSMETYRSFFTSAQTVVQHRDPLILDLDGDGVETTNVKDGAYFDHDGNGFAEQTGWAGANDGLLVWDRDGDGGINDGTELFGDHTLLKDGTRAMNGFQALAEWDDNADGRIDANDAVWANLKVWQDANGDGFSAAGELLSLSDVGIQAINLGFTSSNTPDVQGNTLASLGSFTRTDGTTGQVGDYLLQRDTTFTIAEEWLAVPADIAALPDLQGFGNVYDLQQAMVRDGSGTLRALVETFAAQTGAESRNATFEQMLFKWTGSDTIDPASRGGSIDARKLAVLEKFFGQTFVGTMGANPNMPAAMLLDQSYQGVFEMMYAQLMAQTHLRSLFDLVTYTWDDTSQSLKGDLTSVAAQIDSEINIDPIGGRVLLGEFARSLQGLNAQGLTNYASFRDSFAAGSEELALIIDSGGKALIAGTAGNDSLAGTSVDEIIYAGDGADTITDSYGSDTIDGGAGDDVITDQDGGTNVLRGGEGNDTVTFSYYANNTIEGGAGDDLIKMDDLSSTTNWYYSNTVEGGTGNDRIQSGGSADTYVFNRGDGQDTINDYDNNISISIDKMVFGVGIAVSDVTVFRSGNHLVLRVADPANPLASDQITIENWDYSSQRIERVEFADGAVWTAADLTNRSMAGTEGADTLTLWSDVTWADGQGGDDTIVSMYTNTTIYGGEGNDTITDAHGSDIIDGGAGDDVITDQGTGTNVLRGDEGNDTVTFSYRANNTVEGGAGDDLIKVDSPWYSNSSYTNTFAGGVGNDRIQSGASADTYLFNRGDGQDTINDYGVGSGGAAGIDKVVFGAGIAASDLTVSRSGNHLVVKVNDPANPAAADQITIENWDSGAYRIERVEFADGTVWTATDLGALAMTGTDGADTLAGWSDGSTILGLDGADTITGSSGSDTIDGGAGDDVIIDQGGGTNVLRGGEGNDTITFSYWANNAVEGGAGDDLIQMDVQTSASNVNAFAGGAGNDRIQSGASADTYLFNRGDGQDAINDNSSGYTTTDTLVFGAGIAAADLTVSRSGDHLVLKVNDPANPAASDQVTVENWDSVYQRIERVEFADGTVWTAADLSALAMTGTDEADTLTLWSDATWADGKGGDDMIVSWNSNTTIYGGDGNDTIFSWNSNATIYGGEGNDTIMGTGSNATIEGGAGDDLIQGGGYSSILVGGAGNDTLRSGASADTADTYLFNRGDGQDTINDYDTSGSGVTDRLVFGAGIAAADLTASRSGDYLVIKVNDPANPAASDQITVENWYSSQYRIEQVQFADGTVWTAADLTNLSMTGTDGSDTLAMWLDATFADGQGGDDTIFSWGSNATIYGGDGNDTIYAFAGDHILKGGMGNDSLSAAFANLGDDILEGGAGDDWLDGGTGNDVYLFARGDGRDVIIDFDSTPGNVDTVRFSEDVLPENVTVLRDANNLYLNITGTGDRLKLQSWFASDAHKVERIEFADGTVWGVTELSGAGWAPIVGTEGPDTLVGLAGVDDVIQGVGGDDRLSGDSGNDTLDGGAGNDYLNGGVGNDIYLFGPGSGQDVISEYDATPGNVDVVRMAEGVTPGDVTVTRDFANLYLSLDGGADRLTLARWFTDDASRIERVEFADGTVWDSAQILEHQSGGTEGADFLGGTAGDDVIAGLGGDDTLVGDSGNDTLDGGAGNDSLWGGEGNDVYLFGPGSGQDVIWEYDVTPGNVDVVRLAPGVAPGDVTLTRDLASLYVSLNGGADRLTLGNWFENNASQIERLEFSDGTVWGVAELARAPIVGTEGADTLSGREDMNDVIQGGGGDDSLGGLSGNDTLEGGAGNDYLDGGAGNDVYLFGTGDGQDTIYEYDETAGNVDTLRFGAGITPNDISVSRDYWDLSLSLNGGADEITLSNWFSSESQIERIEFADGTVWDTADVASRIVVPDGTDGPDQISGSEGDDQILGLAGDDDLYGGAGNDVIDGGAGYDELYDDAGNNALFGGDGSDELGAENGNNVLQGQEGDDYLWEYFNDLPGNNLLDGGAGNDYLEVWGNTLAIGGAGDDEIDLGDDSTGLIAFNRGDGQDTVYAYEPSSLTLSLGGGIAYEDMAFRREDDSLILELGGVDSITFQDWYAAPVQTESTLNLQVIADAQAAYDPGSADPLLNTRVQQFDLGTLVEGFDQAQAQDPMLERWNLMDSLLDAHLAASDTEALGGDLAYYYGKNGALTGIGVGAAQDVLSFSGFGSQPQALRPIEGLQEGLVRLA